MSNKHGIIAGIIAATFATSVIRADVGDWIEGVAQGIDTVVSIAIHIRTFNNDYEDSKLDIGVELYEYESRVNYPMASLSYVSKWRVARDFFGNYHYRKTQSQNGTVFLDSTELFEVGMTSGLPLTRRIWNCSVKTPELWFDASSRSTLQLWMQHTVTRPAQFFANIPSRYEVQAYFFGWLWLGVCGPAPLTQTGWGYSTDIPRQGRTTFPYEGTNIEINQIFGRVKL